VILLRLEQTARRNGGDHSSEAVAALADACGNLFDRRPIAEAKGPAERERSQVMDHGADELVLPVPEQEALEAVGAV
jgi:hypothetical protein